MHSALLRDVLMNNNQLQNFLICSMQIGSIHSGSVFLFDLSPPFHRPEMRSRFDLFQETLDELEHLGLAAPDAPQVSNEESSEDIFSRFNIFKKK